MAVASARLAAPSRRATTISRCSGPVPRSLRASNGVPELEHATRDAGRAALEDASPSLSAAPKPARAPATASVAVLTEPAMHSAAAATPVMHSAVVPALAAAAAVRPREVSRE